MELTYEDIDIIEDWWINKARKNFLAYRQYMRNDKFFPGWFIADLSSKLQQFYVDLKAGLRPVLLIQSPPQHGKSWSVSDFIAWLAGMDPAIRTIYATYSDTLGTRCNLSQQRQMDSLKYQKVFPGTQLSRHKGGAKRTTNHLEYVDENEQITDGQFRNTTVGGGVTGESLDVGVIDDAVKGREQANSITWSQKIWEWFTDDFNTRFSDMAGLLVIMTRWTTHDIIARLIDIKDEFEGKFTIVNYQAIATQDEGNRQTGDPLFPELKSLSFLEGKKRLMSQSSWEALFQGNPTVTGGNLFKDNWWQWYTKLPLIKYKFITADTAQKTKNQNDWTVFQCWGYGVDGKIYLLDKVREKFEAPELRREAEMFYNKHNTPRINVTDPVLRAMYIEDKSSGIGLIQELKRLHLKVKEVPRVTDKYLRGEDAAPYVELGNVVLNTSIPGVGNLTKEAREFPNGDFDDDIDTCMTAIEVTYINKDKSSMLKAAMEA
jgi:predicted phage terminase large subunit-like protein